MLSVVHMMQESEGRVEEEEEEVRRRREVGCQWESPVEEEEEEEVRRRREVGCQWESPVEEEEEEEVRRRREVGCQWESPVEEEEEEEVRRRREVGCQWESPVEEEEEEEEEEEVRRRREVGCQWESPVEEEEEEEEEEVRRRREVGCQWESPVEEEEEEEEEEVRRRREVGCQWESPVEEEEEEEEEVRRRREVGCQWESPVEERREVGCQSDSAERRDAAVQVDLLTQQLSWRHPGVCGVAWQCVSVRADEPGGGALLQHCSTLDTGQHSPHLRHTLLPTMPLSGPPAPAAPQQAKELQQTTPLPSMPLCEPLPPADESVPPPGLIAPLSPHLAEEEEEEEEEEDEGLLKLENNGSFHGNGQSTVTAEKRRRRRGQRSEGSARSCNTSGENSQPVKLANHVTGKVRPDTRRPGSTACCKRMRDDDKKSQPDRRQDVIQSGERSSVQKVRSKTQRGETRRRCMKRGQPAARIEHTRAEGGENRMMVKKDEEEEGGQKRRRTEQQRTDELMVKKEEKETGRPRRKTVGPPIRYLLESEERSHGLSSANQGKVVGVKMKRKLEGLRKEHQEEDEDENEEEQEEEEEDGVKPVKTEVTGRPRRKTVGPPIRYLLESEERSHSMSVANHSKVSGVKVDRKLGKELREEKEEEERRAGVEITERIDSSRMELSDGGVGRRRQHCQVCSLTSTCPSSLRLHLSIHREGRRLSYHLCNNKFSRANTLHLHCRRHHHGNPGGHHSNRETTTSGRTRAAGDKQDEEVNTKRDGERKEREEQSKEEEEKTLLPASTKAPDWSRCIKRVRRNPRWWVDYRTTMRRRRQDVERWRRQQERDGGSGRKTKMWREEEEVKKEVVEQPQRPRRKMVGPPIRYLLESEEPSHCLVIANQDRAKGFTRGGKPQKKNKAMIDRPEDTEQTDRQAGHMITEIETNQDRVNGPNGRGGRSKKGVIDSERGGGASEMTDTSDAAERQMDYMVTERQKTLLPASTKAPDWSRCIKRVHRNPQWWVDYRSTMRRRRQDAERWRRRQERDGGSGRKTKTWREEEEEVKGVCVKEEGGGEEGENKGERRKRDGGEENEGQMEVKKEVVEQPQRPRRNMVGPPIRYLLESEEPSQGPVTANQDRVNGPKGRVGRPKKVVTDSEARGGASEMTDRSDAAERQTGQTVSDRQTGLYGQIYLVYKDMQSGQVTIISPCCVRLQRLI